MEKTTDIELDKLLKRYYSRDAGEFEFDFKVYKRRTFSFKPILRYAAAAECLQKIFKIY